MLVNRARDLGALHVWACLALYKVYEGDRRPRIAHSKLKQCHLRRALDWRIGVCACPLHFGPGGVAPHLTWTLEPH